MEAAESYGHPLVIFNPAANRGKMKLLRLLVQDFLEREEGATYHETTRAGEAEQLAREGALQGRAIVVVGGDGSVHEVVNGILSSGQQVPLGIVPAGSGNDYAWNLLKLPRDPRDAVERAFYGQLVEVDAGTVNGRYFANAFSVGLDANIGAAAGWMKKVPLMSGSRLYYGATLHQLLFAYHHCPWLRFALDGEELRQEQHYVLLAVNNGPTYGAGFRIAPHARGSDGLFDVCTIDYAPLLRALRMLPVVQKGEHSSEPEVSFYKAKKVRVESRKSLNMQIDGEILQNDSFDIEVLPAALLIRV